MRLSRDVNITKPADPIKDHVNNTQSTHGSAAQPSAARLIVLLSVIF